MPRKRQRRHSSTTPPAPVRRINQHNYNRTRESINGASSRSANHPIIQSISQPLNQATKSNDASINQRMTQPTKEGRKQRVNRRMDARMSKWSAPYRLYCFTILAPPPPPYRHYHFTVLPFCSAFLFSRTHQSSLREKPNINPSINKRISPPYAHSSTHWWVASRIDWLRPNRLSVGRFVDSRMDWLTGWPTGRFIDRLADWSSGRPVRLLIDFRFADWVVGIVAAR